MSATVEKKVALTIEMKGVGGQQIGQLTVNLKGLDDASKKAAASGEKTSASLEKIGKSFLGFLKLDLAIKAVKELGQAFQALISNSLAMQSSGSPLVAQFEAAASKIKVSAASIAGAALPAIDGMATAAGDAMKEIADFVNTNRELIATNIVAWAVDSGRALISGVAVAATLANKSIHGLEMGWNSLKAAAMGTLAEMERREGGKNAEANAKIFQTSADKALAAASASVREMKKYDETIDNLVSKAGTYLNKAEKVGLELAKARPRFSDPTKDADAVALAERKTARFIELATLAHDKETALSMLSFAVFKLHEEQKMTIAGETRSAYVARQAAIEDKLRATDQLEQQIYAKELARTAALAALRKDAEDKRLELFQSNADRREEIAKTEFERQKLFADRLLADASTKIGMMESGFAKGQALTTQVQRIEAEKRRAIAASETAYAIQLDQESKAAKVSAIQEYKAAAEGVLSTVVGAFKDLFKAGLEGSRDMGQVALGILGSIGEAILDKLLGMFVSFLATKVAETLVNAAIATTTGIAAAAAQIPAEAALAGAAAVASTAAIPIFGPALAPEAGAAAYAAALAYLPLAALATGGLVLGGSPNFDSVPAMLQRGEYVIPAQQVRENVRAGRAPDDSGSSGGSGGAGVTIAVTQQSFVPGTKADFHRSVRDAVLPAISDLARAGLLRLR